MALSKCRLAYIRLLIGSPSEMQFCQVLQQRATYASQKELHDSMSDGFYDIKSPTSTLPKSGNIDRPNSFDVKSRQKHLTEPLPGILHDSLSEADHAYRPRAIARSSVADPTYFLGSSLADGTYQMPSALRAASRNFTLRPQGHSSAGPRSLPILQKIVAHPQLAMLDRLNNSFSDAEIGHSTENLSDKAHSLPPHQIELIFTDVDGTLLDSNQQLSAKVKKAVAAAASIQIPLVIATGKAIGPWTNRILPQLETRMPQIFLQGLLIRDYEQGIIYSRNLEADVFEEAIKFAKFHKLTLVAYCGNGDRIVTEKRNFHSDRLIFYGEPVPESLGPLEDHINSPDLPVYKVIFMDEEERIQQIRPFAEEKFEIVASLTTAIPGMLEVLPLGASKGAAIAWLLQRLCIEPEKCLALGDGENDIEMLELVGFGVGVANAVEKVKAVANAVVKSNNDDGVADAIEKYILQPRGLKL